MTTTDKPIALEDLFTATLTAIREHDEDTVTANTARIAAACGTDEGTLSVDLAAAAADADAAETLLDDLQVMGQLMTFKPTVRREYNFAIPDRPDTDTRPGGAAYNPADLRGVFL